MERRLAAILAADVVGYSRLMGEDETGTLAALKAHRKELIEPKAAQYHGSTIKLMGDGELMEFASVVDAVAFSVEVQVAMNERNAEVSEDRRIVYRIGINIGDVIVEDEDIYGDGVNIAARLEGLAEPGGICVARNVYNQVRDKLALDFEDLGAVEAKNIARPIQVFRVILDDRAAALATPVVQAPVGAVRSRWPVLAAGLAVSFLAIVGLAWLRPWAPDVEPASLEKMAFPLPEKPSIAVLPFDNLSGDPEQAYFADGMTDDLITGLTKLSGLFVISRNSTFTYKGNPVKVQQVAEELGVRYVLEGSVRRAGDQVRINAQLIDATTGGHLWAERYDGAMGNIFALQDKITQKIVAALAVQLTPDEWEQAASIETDNIAAYDAFLQGWELFQRYIPVDNARAVPHFERAIKFDPEFARAYAALGATYLRGSLYAAFHRALGVPSPLNMRMGQASENLRKALAIDESEPLALQTSALWRLSYGQHDKGLADARRAVALQPNDADGHATLARLLNYSGMPKEAARSVQTAMRLNPYYRTVYLEDLGHAQLLTGRHEEAAKTLERAVERNPNLPEARVFLTAAYGYLGRAREAEVHITEVRRLRSVFTLGAVRKSSAYTNYKNPDDLERLVAGLRKAYVPEAGVVRSNQTILTGDEKSALLSGKTWIGIAPQTDDHYWVDVDEDGMLTFRGAYGDLTGTWRDMGKGWCRDVPSFGPEECGFLVRNENGSFDEKNEYSWVESSAEFPFSLQP